jgi:hypothetical protein
MRQFDPKATFGFDATNGRKARESRHWLKAQDVPVGDIRFGEEIRACEDGFSIHLAAAFRRIMRLSDLPFMGDRDQLQQKSV